jgi:hypothetical protein
MGELLTSNWTATLRLRLHGQLDVIESDVLKVDFTALAQTLRDKAGQPELRLRVVGNLPYNISTPILFHLLDHVQVIEDQHFMLQKEVIDRMVASPATGDYGRLSVMLQWRYAMENVLFVPPESFDPPPRVDSAVVRMVPHAEPPAVRCRCWRSWSRWLSASAASCCATRWAAGYSKQRGRPQPCHPDHSMAHSFLPVSRVISLDQISFEYVDVVGCPRYLSNTMPLARTKKRPLGVTEIAFSSIVISWASS